MASTGFILAAILAGIIPEITPKTIHKTIELLTLHSENHYNKQFPVVSHVNAQLIRAPAGEHWVNQVDEIKTLLLT
jgi:hypothetical protein